MFRRFFASLRMTKIVTLNLIQSLLIISLPRLGRARVGKQSSPVGRWYLPRQYWTFNKLDCFAIAHNDRNYCPLAPMGRESRRLSNANYAYERGLNLIRVYQLCSLHRLGRAREGKLTILIYNYSAGLFRYRSQ